MSKHHKTCPKVTSFSSASLPSCADGTMIPKLRPKMALTYEDTKENDEPTQPHKKSRVTTADEILAELARSAVEALSQQSVVTEETEDEPPQSPATFLKRAGLFSRPVKRRQNITITPPRLPGSSPCKEYPRGDVTPGTASAAQCLLELHR